ncbi:alpha/beta hydrolase [Pikeienuella sp. HZG-20]|uniref:alpha/beta hydrolase n=1 Tax=Paludibacillus litoralis TaxID=3133267 RepID=UPI0030ECF8CA
MADPVESRLAEPAPLYTELAEAPEHGRAFWIASGIRRIRAAVWGGGERGVALIFTGRTEYIEKYGRVVTALTERGFSVAALDWRGQGLSDRPLANRMKGHVASFAAYQRDVGAFLAAPEVAGLKGERVLICHSMGGCVGVRALLEERLEPAATILSAPMLGLALSPLAHGALEALIALSRRFGFETSFAAVTKGARPYVERQAFPGNVLTGDADHYGWFRKHLEAEPGFALGAPTFGWLAEALEETTALRAAPAPAVPMLALLGGEEAVVSAEAIRAFAAKARSCRLVELPGGRHETLFETPAIRDRVWEEIDAFLADSGV